MFKIRNLEVTYKKNKVLDIKSFSFPNKGKVIIRGANGSGKTTLLKSLMNIIKYKGDIYYNDINIKEYREDLYKKVCYIDQFSNLFSYLSEKRNYDIVNECLNINSNEKYERKKLRKYSGGQRKIIEEKRLDIDKYETFLLDEPSVSLDKKHKKALIDKINELAINKLVIIVTHDEDFYSNDSIIYDIDSLNNDFELDEKHYEYIKVYQGQRKYNKISIHNFFSNIISFIFLAIMSFSILITLHLYNYRQTDFSKKYVNNVVYYPIVKEYYESLENDETCDLDLTYSAYVPNNVKAHLSSDNRKFIYTGQLGYIFFSNIDEEILVSDALAYYYFNDYRDHKGDIINVYSPSGNISLTISNVVDTCFSNTMDKEEFEELYNNIVYIVLPNRYKDVLVNNTKEGIHFFSSATKFGYEDIKGYVPYIYVNSNYKLNEKILFSKNIFLFMSICSTILFFYSYFSLNIKNKKKLNDLFKLKCLGVSYNRIMSIFNLPFIIMNCITIAISSLSYICLYKLNLKFEPAYYINEGYSYINLYIFPFIILIGIMCIVNFIRYYYCKLKIEENI